MEAIRKIQVSIEAMPSREKSARLTCFLALCKDRDKAGEIIEAAKTPIWEDPEALANLRAITGEKG